MTLAACFVNDLGTVIALGACFANYNWTIIRVCRRDGRRGLASPDRLVRWFFARYSGHVSEPGIKVIFLAALCLGGIGGESEERAVLPAYIMVVGLASVGAKQRARFAGCGRRCLHC